MINIKKEIMTDNVIKQIMYIDSLFYKDSFTIDWYKERYNENNISFCLYDEYKMVGYIVITGIKKELYDDLKDGKYSNDYDVDSRLFDPNSKYKYLVSINILEEYRNKGYGYKLFDIALNYFDKPIISITVSKEGYSLVSKRMKFIMNVNEDVSVFEYI